LINYRAWLAPRHPDASPSGHPRLLRFQHMLHRPLPARLRLLLLRTRQLCCCCACTPAIASHVAPLPHATHAAAMHDAVTHTHAVCCLLCMLALCMLLPCARRAAYYCMLLRMLMGIACTASLRAHARTACAHVDYLRLCSLLTPCNMKHLLQHTSEIR
jgi:hypothetical protein